MCQPCRLPVWWPVSPAPLLGGHIAGVEVGQRAPAGSIQVGLAIMGAPTPLGDLSWLRKLEDCLEHRAQGK